MKATLDMLSVFVQVLAIFFLAFGSIVLSDENKVLLGQLSQCQQSLLEEVAQ